MRNSQYPYTPYNFYPELSPDPYYQNFQPESPSLQQVAVNQIKNVAKDQVKNQARDYATEQVAPELFANWSAMPMGPQAGIIGGTLLTLNGAKNMLKGKDSWDIKDNPVGAASRASLAVATGGISEVGRKLGLFGHKSTKQHQKERWEKIAKDPQTNDFWKQAASVADQVRGSDMAGKMIGADGKPTKWDFNTVTGRIKAGDANETAMFRNVLGHQKTFGNDWAKYTPEQQDKMIQAFANAGIYKGDKGDVVISDAKKAQAIRDQIIASANQPTTNNPKYMSNVPNVPQSIKDMIPKARK